MGLDLGAEGHSPRLGGVGGDLRPVHDLPGSQSSESRPGVGALAWFEHHDRDSHLGEKSR